MHACDNMVLSDVESMSIDIGDIGQFKWSPPDVAVEQQTQFNFSLHFYYYFL